MTDFAKEFLDMMQKWHEQKEVYDDDLRIEIAKNEIDIVTNPIIKFPPWGAVYFSASSANACPRSLYLKALGAKKDSEDILGYRTRWQKTGTFISTLVQTDLLFIEKHWERIFGKKSPFYLERTPRNHPAFEDFAKTYSTHKHRGHDINLFGSPDGILVHRETGIRVGLEIKSKQTTPGATGHYKMKEATPDHVQQTCVYAKQHNLDHYIIYYMNLSKKSWNMTEEEMAKSPDIRAFNVETTEEKKDAVLDYFADILDAIKAIKPPKLDVDKWTFNNFKIACAEDLTDEEFNEIKDFTKRAMKAKHLKEWQKQEYLNLFSYIEDVRDK